MLEGLPADSAFVARVHEEREQAEDWRRKLGEVTKRDYSSPRRRRVLYHGEKVS